MRFDDGRQHATALARGLASGTTRDLLDGSGLVLDPRGDYELKGLSGSRTIFALRR